MSRGTAADPGTVRVWDPLVRIGHWLLALSILFAWLTRTGSTWHELIGYVSLGIVAVRVLWGWFGPRHARFADFVHGLRKTLSYAGALLSGTESRHLGHNPLGGWMILALLTTTALVGLSGWLYTTDRYWGVEWVETMHRWLANALLVLVGLHVLGVLHASLHQRENLIASMVHGRKRSL